MTRLWARHTDMADNNRFGDTTLAAAPVAYRWAFHRGWVEAQNTRRFCRAYDTEMTPREQIAYECGRLLVVNVIAAKLTVPVWHGHKAGCESVERAYHGAAQLCGPALSGRFV